MKPLKLKIKGVNSFIDQQEVDFERLAKNHFFGIFGPTGSGKSTILDGITLALYGQVSRKSDNFINLNMDAANVSFTFLISGKVPEKYRVEREFKRDKHSSRPRSGKCKVVLLTGEKETVLTEGVKEVNAMCQEIIGLKYDDFTRTVVLPQGKFSEFLALKGSDRNNMLERLFNLEQYGEELTGKLKERKEKERRKDEKLQGELNAYGEVDEEKCREKEKELKQVEEQLNAAGEEREAAEQAYKEQETVWKLQQELAQLQQEAQALELRRPEIEQRRAAVETAEKAGRVMADIEEWREKAAEAKKLASELSMAAAAKAQRKKENTEANLFFEQAQAAWNERLPELKNQEARAREAIGIADEIKAIEKEIQEKQKERSQAEKECRRLRELSASMTEQLEQKKGQQQSGERQKAELKVEAEDKNRIQQGVIAERDYREQQGRLDLLNQKQADEEARKIRLSQQLKTTQDELEKKRQEVRLQEERLKGLKEKPAISAEQLNQLYEQMTACSAKWESYKQLTSACQKHDDEAKKTEQLRQQEEQKVLRLKEEAERLEREKSLQNTMHLAMELRRNLAAGQPCPVCGSLHHDPDYGNEMAGADGEELSRRLQMIGKEHQAALENAARLAAEYRSADTAMQEAKRKLAELGNDFLESNPEDLRTAYEQSKAAASDYNRQLNEAEQLKNELNEEFHELNNLYTMERTALTAVEETLAQYAKELTELLALVKEKEAAYLYLKEVSGVADFSAAQQDISDREKKTEEIEAVLQRLAREIDRMNEEWNNTSVKLADQNTAFELLKAELNNLDLKQQDKRQQIKDRIGEAVDAAAYQKKLADEIKRLESAYQEAEAQKKKSEAVLEEINGRYYRLSGQYGELEKDCEKRREVMAQKVTEAGFADDEAVEKAVLEKAVLEELQNMIQHFQEQLNKNVINTESVREKLGGRRLGEDQWSAVCDQRAALEQKQKELEKTKSGLRFEVDELNRKLTQIKKIMAQKQKLEHTISMLAELEKMFRGKKFVQFVAAERLKYVSRMASKTLLEISGGSYELITNSNGEFVIKDYKNGGVEREASTLSGGETFLASLSLALALSTQIQLTNNAPLELFFLDEGFGTLDENLLEEVISALERLQNSRRAIGLISHVTEIKNRVPVKLVIEPAELGLQGSRVRIEIS